MRGEGSEMIDRPSSTRTIPVRLAIQLLPRADVLRQDRIAKMDAEIAWLYREVDRLEGKRESLIRRTKDDG